MFLRRIPILLASVFLWSACSDSKTYQVGIVKPLMVLNVTPGGADNVPLDSELTVQFSDPVVEGSLTPDTVMLAGPEEAPVPLEAAFTYDGAENKLTLKPAKPFAYSAVYTLTITKKVKRLADKAVVAKEIVHTFRTIDPPVLSIIESAPSGNSTSIGTYVDVENAMTPYGERVSTTVIVHFSEGINKESVTAKSFTLKDSAGVAVSGVFTWESTDKKAKDLLDIPIATDDILTFTPDAPLALSTVYTVTLTGTFKGIISKRATSSAGWFAENVVWTFRTIDPPPLGLVSSVPSAKAVNVGPIVYFAAGVTTTGGEASIYGNAVSHNVVLSFTESVDIESFAANVTLVVADEFGVPSTLSTDGIAGTWTYSSSDTMSTEPWKVSDTWTFVPAAHWSLSGNYAVVIKNTLESYRATDAGGSIEHDITIAWEAAHPSALQLVNNSPADKATNVGPIVYRNGATLITVADNANADKFGNRVKHDVVLEFNESVDVSLFAAVKVFVADESGVPTATEVAGAWVSSNSSGTNPWRETDTWTFTPTTEWSLSGNYAVVIPATVASYRATPEAGTLTKAYTIDWEAAHPAALQLVNNSPADGATNVGTIVYRNGGTLVNTGESDQYGNVVDHDVVLEFSESVNPTLFAAVKVFTADEAGAPTATEVAGTWTPTNSQGSDPWHSTNTWTFVPTAEWSLSGNYAVVIPSTVASYRATTEGGSVSQAYSIDWEEAHPLPLRVVSVTPSDGSLDLGAVSSAGYGAAATYQIVVRFSEAIDTAMLADITLTDLETNTITQPFALSDSGANAWRQNDTISYVLTSALSKNWRVNIPSTLETYRATSESGALGGSGVAFTWDMADPLPLVLENTFPGNGAEVSESFVNDVNSGTDNGDEVGVAFTMWFSEPVDRVSLEAAFAFEENGNDITGLGTFSYSGGDTAVTFTPPALQLSSTYEVSLVGGSIATPFGGVESFRGNAVEAWYDTTDDTGGYLDGNQTIWFTTPDPEALTIVAISPSVDGTLASDNVARDTSIVITFSEAVTSTIIAAIEANDQNNTYAVLTTGSATPVPATYTFSGAGTVLTINPTADLLYSTVHELAIDGGSTGIASWRVTSVSGWLVPTGTTVYEFKTIDPSFLTIWATSPSNNEDGFGVSVSDVAVDSKIQILFDQEVDQASFTANITIERCGASVSSCATATPVSPSDITFHTFPSGAQKATIDIGSMTFDTYFRITLVGGTNGVVSLNNSGACAVACEGGYLPDDYIITFGTRSIPPLRVLPVSPEDGENGVGIRPTIVVEFQSPLSTATLTQYTYFVTDVTNNLLVERYDGTSYYPGANTAAIYLTSDLAFDTEYNIVLLSSVQGTDGRFLGREVRFNFHTKRATLVLDTDPSNSDTGIELNLAQRDTAGSLTIFFDGAVTTVAGVTPEMAMNVTYVTARGTVMLRGTVTDLGDTWIFNPADFCVPGLDPLVDNTTYYINLTDEIWRLNGSAQLVGGYQARFSTANFSVIGDITATNAVTGKPDLTIDLKNDTDSIGGAGKDDVPINARFTVAFTELMDVSTITYSGVADPVNDTLLLMRSNGTYANLKSVSLNSSGVSFNADDTAYNLVTNDLAFATSYTLVIRSTVRDLAGNPLSSDYTLTFTTSPQPTATLVPVTDLSSKDRKAPSGAVFNVAVAIDSLTDDNFTIGEAAAACGTLVGAQGLAYTSMPVLLDLGYDGHAAMIIPTPIMGASLCHKVTLLVGTDGPRDIRGNPFAGAGGAATSYVRYFDSIANDNTSTFAVVNTATYSPLAGGTVTGRQSIKATITAGGNDVLVTSINPTNFFVYSDAGRTIAVPGRVYFDPVNTQAVFDIAEGSYFNAGSTYYVKMSQNISSTSRNNCPTCANYTFIVEAVAPTVSSIVPSGTGVAANTAVTVTFNEAVRLSTLATGISVYPTGSPGSPVSGTWTLSANNLVATFTRTGYYTASQQYTVAATGVKDLAGTTQVTSNGTFTVENVAPTFSSAAASVASVGANIDVTFSESVAVETVLASLYAGTSSLIPGTVRFVVDGSGDPSDPLNNTLPGSEIFACVSVNGNIVTFDPLEDLLAGTTYNLGVGPDGFAQTIEDLGGTPMVGVDTSFTFTTP